MKKSTEIKILVLTALRFIYWTITALAALLFIVSMASLDSMSAIPIHTWVISGAWLGLAMWHCDAKTKKTNKKEEK